METIKEISEALRGTLLAYIEATYHVSDPALIAQRRALLEREGVIHRAPFIESTPRYRSGTSFADIPGMPRAAKELFAKLSESGGDLPRIVHDPPYVHQSEALQAVCGEGRNVMIMTGTGSGKTEAFLLPVIARLAREASERPSAFEGQRAMRALVLYPMNALVNDQLGRLRSLLGDPRLAATFKEWAGRPPQFARYTSRTPYPGIRTRKKDVRKLRPIGDYFVEIFRRAHDADADEHERSRALALMRQLQGRGKWPAKPDLAAWFGQKGSPWQDRATGRFLRCVALPDDSELLTRQEVQATPPDVLVTNYSMLEYMLMRPIERPIFDATREWLRRNPEESFLVVLDEAHLYRGASGAEVALLIRRLKDRLGVGSDRFQVVCATASFGDPAYAAEFGAQLSGASQDSFAVVKGDFDFKERQDRGTFADAEALAKIRLEDFYEADTEKKRLAAIEPLLSLRGIQEPGSASRALYDALKDFGPMGRLINVTMVEAMPAAEIGKEIFEESVLTEFGDKAATALLALGSVARPEPRVPGLLPCRLHGFFRGLPGLWACMDPECISLDENHRSGICGKLYSQPRDRCDCGSRVFELFTCRNCGTAYGRAYTDNVEDPHDLWPEPGEEVRTAEGTVESLESLDLLLEAPAQGNEAEPASLDLDTGQLNAGFEIGRTRMVHIPPDRFAARARAEDEDGEDETAQDEHGKGQFKPCAVCGRAASFGRSSVQDHQTKGDQPFQALLTKQVQIQPPGPQEATRFAPLRGRKALAFSDSRQVAARLAPNVQMYSARDALRPLILSGFKFLQKQETIRHHLCLDDVFLAVLLASNWLNVRIRPEFKEHESFDAESLVREAYEAGEHLDKTAQLELLMAMRKAKHPESFVADVLSALTDRFYGMKSLALASVCEEDGHRAKIFGLPEIPGLAEDDAAKLALARHWMGCWPSFGLTATPTAWVDRPASDGFRIRTRSKTSKLKAMNQVLPEGDRRKKFWADWRPSLSNWFLTSAEGNKAYLNGSNLSLQIGGEWVHCRSCKAVERPIPGRDRCANCGSERLVGLNPDQDPVFLSRKGFYRNPVLMALEDPPKPPVALIAAEHTAQLGGAQDGDAFSKAEEHELLFQDIEYSEPGSTTPPAAIDVLSSTTTMEVGIDLGELSGVALRNMPPSRANYQQRAGRAGRRANAIATVVGFGSADSHDEHYFSKPETMIRGTVLDPRITLGNPDIARRHVRAYLLQSYHQAKVETIDPNQPHDLFSVLGSVSDFQKTDSVLNLRDFERWLRSSRDELRERLALWLPEQLEVDEREKILNGFVDDCVHAIKDALEIGDNRDEDEDVDPPESATDDIEEIPQDETASETGQEAPQNRSAPKSLLDRLLYCGKLPRYAFPTDVATFNVFDLGKSGGSWHVMKYAPSQNLSVALSQYAPGRQVWIAGKCYTSGAIYSMFDGERSAAWAEKRVFRECDVCGHAETSSSEAEGTDVKLDCPSCSANGRFGPARHWMRPPGFAHPVYKSPVTSPDDVPEISYATRAKLTMKTPSETAGWRKLSDWARVVCVREHLLVSNSGPKREGYNYCTKCGTIEAYWPGPSMLGGPHRKPFPAKDGQETCDGGRTARKIVLGTDFITDIALFSLKVEDPVSLTPGLHRTRVALRTVSDAIAAAACRLLDIENGELVAEFRPAQSSGRDIDREAEIFVYDTLPGGAGFASQVAMRGREVLVEALDILRNCPEGCDASCYRCLRSFKNRIEHRFLDRHVGAELLGVLLDGKGSGFNIERLNSSTSLLFDDLVRRKRAELELLKNVAIPVGSGRSVTAPIVARSGGRQVVVALSGAVTEGVPADAKLQELSGPGQDLALIVKSELMVRENLPFVSKQVLDEIG